jgi:hypothetical protein
MEHKNIFLVLIFVGNKKRITISIFLWNPQKNLTSGIHRAQTGAFRNTRRRIGSCHEERVKPRIGKRILEEVVQV